MSRDEKTARHLAAFLEENARARDSDRDTRPERLPLMATVVLAIGASPVRAKRARDARRSHPIRGYVGPNGGGKSLAMVHDVLPSLAAGRRILSTVRILGPDGQPHPNYVPFTNFDQLLDAEETDVLADEITGIANSRASSSLPVQVQNTLVQLRRRDNTFAWTAPGWGRADKVIREVTQAVTECRGFWSDRREIDSGASGVRMWAPKRVFRWRTYDTIEFDEWTSGKRDKLDTLAKQWFRGPGSEAFRSYDTLDSVSIVEGGDPDVCDHCGKHKRRVYCTGHNDLPEKGLQDLDRDFPIGQSWSLLGDGERASVEFVDELATVAGKNETPA